MVAYNQTFLKPWYNMFLLTSPCVQLYVSNVTSLDKDLKHVIKQSNMQPAFSDYNFSNHIVVWCPRTSIY